MLVIHEIDNIAVTPAPKSFKPPNFRTLDLNLLRVFDEVMAERSLTRAARNLSLTQPAVSNAMRRLRETLGDDLVQRHGQGMAPTPRALAIWPAVRDALRQLQASLAPDDFLPARATTRFVLAMADATAAELLPGLVDILERQAPGVSIRVVPLTTRDPRPMLDSEACDLAVGHFPSVVPDLTAKVQNGETMPFFFERLYDGDYVCVMRERHHLAEGSLSLNAFCAARHLLVSFSGQPYGFIDESLAALGRRRRVVLTVNQFSTAGWVAAHSDLLTVLPQHFVRLNGMGAGLAVRPLPFAVSPVHVDSLWHRRSDRHSAQIWLRQALRQVAAQAFVA